MKVALAMKHGALILFNLEAAFPCLSQQLLHQILGQSGLPAHIRRVISRLYHNKRCSIKIR
eukprot:15208685-Heterocapsa_arctica.AAC.1